MRLKIFIAVTLLCPLLCTPAFAQPVYAQNEGSLRCRDAKKSNFPAARNNLRVTVLSNAEMDYDMKYVKLDLGMNNMNTQISGSATTKALVTAASLATYAFELDQVMIIDSMKLNGTLVIAAGSGTLRTVSLSTPLAQNTTFTAQVWYHGEAPETMGNFPKGLNNQTSPSWGNHVTYTLSESYAANDWWPTKQLLVDKIDSSDVWLTVPDSLMAGSNGVLQAATTLSGSRKRYQWHNSEPIDYYLISAAVAGYVDYSYYQHFTDNPDDSVLMQNYVYNNPNTLPYWKDNIDSTGLMIDYLSTLFGRYPFWQQKYGHCMAPLGGGMEHQTMTTLGTFGTTLTVHEMGHQWWGDHVTCASWKDIWLNEGFASYIEYLYAYHFWSPAQGFAYMADAHNNVMSLPDGSVYCPDTTDEGRIFDGRLTYDKGSAAIHTLRFWIGSDGQFFQGLRDYQTQYGNSTAFTTDLKSSMETSTGIALDTFFNEWIFGEGYPTYTAQWNQTGSTVLVQLAQTTSDPSVSFFAGPLEIRLKSGSQDTTIRVTNTANNQLFSFQWAKNVTGVELDPNDWITNQVGSISHNSSLAVAEVAEMAPVVFPNPATNTWHLKALPGKALLIVTDIAGRALWQQDSDSSVTDIPAQGLAAGVYLLRINSGGRTDVMKLVKE